jgi:hypothetical protein
MKWLKDFFFCNTWREFFVLMAGSSMLLVCLWFLVVLFFVLFG